MSPEAEEQPVTPLQRETCTTMEKCWGSSGEWTQAQYVWLGHIAFLPPERRQRAISSTLMRTIGAAGKEAR